MRLALQCRRNRHVRAHTYPTKTCSLLSNLLKNVSFWQKIIKLSSHPPRSNKWNPRRYYHLADTFVLTLQKSSLRSSPLLPKAEPFLSVPPPLQTIMCFCKCAFRSKAVQIIFTVLKAQWVSLYMTCKLPNDDLTSDRFRRWMEGP